MYNLLAAALIADVDIVPARRETVGSLRFEDHKVSATANEDSLEKDGRQ